MKEEWLLPGAVVPVDPDTTKALVDEIKRLIGVIGGMALQAAAPVQEPVAFNAGVPPLYPEMKDGETISVEYTTPPGGRQSEDCLTAAQEDIQRLSALVRAQQITIDKLEQDRSAPVQEPVAIVDEDGVIVVCNYKYKPGDKFYTNPPAAQRQWVGLTDEEIAKLDCYDHLKFARAIEAKLRSKNNG
jgi:hypothetical protein